MGERCVNEVSFYVSVICGIYFFNKLATLSHTLYTPMTLDGIISLVNMKNMKNASDMSDVVNKVD